MTTLADSPAATMTARPVTRNDAMKFMAKGHTARSLLDLAAVTAAPPDFLLILSEAVGDLEAEGLTPAACRDLLGWSPELTARVIAESAPAPAVPSQRAACELDRRHATLVTREQCGKAAANGRRP